MRGAPLRLAYAVVIAVAGFAFASPAASKEPPPASEEEITGALGAFQDWTAAFMAGDYRAQWLLTDRRIRRWHDRKRWKKWMTAAQARNGELKSYTIEAAAPAVAADLPCTETGHCFRPGVQYVLIVIRSDYEKVTPQQPEFAVMSNDDGEWRFGGGAFLNRPLGETAVIMTVQDERRYKPGFSINQ